jgi:F-type H+-transporting ATPase subunit epsilon
MATFHFDLVSPEKIAFSGEVDQVDIPGAEGDFGVLAGHAPLVAALKPGIMVVRAASGQRDRIIVLGGLAEVSAKGLTVLADVATSIEDLDRASFDRTIAEMEKDLEELAQGSELDKAITRLDHFKAIRDHIETTGMH